MKISLVLLLLLSSVSYGYVSKTLVNVPPYFTIQRGLPFVLHRKITYDGSLSKAYVEEQAHHFGFPNLATLLRYAAFDGYADVVRQLAVLGEHELNAADFNDALSVAAQRNTFYLRTAIPDIPASKAYERIASKNNAGDIPSPHIFVRDGMRTVVDTQARNEVIRALVAHGADPIYLHAAAMIVKDQQLLSLAVELAQGNVDTLSQLYVIASKYGQVSIVRQLAELGVSAHVDLNAVLRDVVVSRHPQAVIEPLLRLLVERGANPNNALPWAGLVGNLPAISLLVEELGATNLDASVWTAALSGNRHAVELLANLRLNHSDKDLPYDADWRWAEFDTSLFDFPSLFTLQEELQLIVRGDPLP